MTAAPRHPITHHRSETIEGVKVFYREAGPKDAPTILLLHGFPTSSHMFRNLIPALADHYRVIAPDYPGYGESDAPDRKTFTQFYGSDELDAAMLMVPLVGFLPGDDERVIGTVAAIEKHLMSDGFVQRYHTHELDDGLPSGEGVFLPCSFWLVDALLMLERDDEAKALFEKLIAVANDLGLLSEEYDPSAKRLLGNFPQAFTHVGLVNSAYNLSKHTGPTHQRGRRGD